jgi:PAS domain S-box-containing protein
MSSSNSPDRSTSASATTGECNLQAIATNLPGIIYQLIQFPDGSRAFAYISTGCRDLWELEPDAIQQDVRSLWNLIHPDDLPRLEAAIAHSAEQLSICSVEYRLITPSGKLKWFQSTSRPERLQSGEILWNGLLLEISDRKVAEQLLQQSEAKFRALVENSSDIIYVRDLEGTFTYVSPQVTPILGYDLEELIGQKVWSIIHPDDRAIGQNNSENVLQSGQSTVGQEVRVQRKDGNWCWMTVNFSLVQDADGQTVGFQGIARDVSQRIRLQEALRQSQQLLQLVLDRIPQTIVWKDRNLVYQGANHNFIQSAGLSSTEASIGKTDSEMPWGETAANERHSDRSVLESGQAVLNWVERIQQADGALSWTKTCKVPLRDATDRVIGILCTVEDITYLKETEEALRKSEERFQHLVAAVPGAIFEFILQPDGANYFSYISAKGCRAIYDREPEQVLYDTVREFARVHPDDVQKAADAMLTSATTLQISRSQIRHFTPSGQLKWVYTSAQPHRQPDGSVVWNGVMIDSTEHKRIEAEMLQQSQRSQLLAELTLKIRQVLQLQDILQTTVTEVRQLLQSDRVIVCQFSPDASGKIHAESVREGCSSRPKQISDSALLPPHYWQQFFGTLQETIFLLEDSERSSLDPEVIALIQNTDIKAMLVVPIVQQQTLWGLLMIQQFDAPRQWSQFEVELLKQLADRVSIALAQAQLLNALQVSETKFRNLVEQTNDIVWELDRDFAFVYVNPQIHKILGYEAATILGKTPLALKSGARARRFRILTQRYISQPRSFTNVETTLRHQAGHEVILESSGAPIFDRAGELQGYRGMSRDITERKQVEIEMLKALVKERELNQLKSRFIAIASHEFRTPLSNISIHTELLQQYSHQWKVEQKQQCFNQIYTEIKKIVQLVDDILVVEKAEAGKLKANPVPIDLALFCQQLIHELRSEDSNQSRIQLNYRSDRETVSLDKKLLHHLLSNLLSNAIKYSPKHSEIRFEVIHEAQAITFRIQDRGIGIPAEDRPYLFSTFYRASNVGVIAGTGLGLVIAKHCATLQRGKIVVDSYVGVGTTFTVTIPL